MGSGFGKIQMASNTVASGKMVTSKVMEFSHGQMEIVMRANGLIH
jgi:hypothetical protein